MESEINNGDALLKIGPKFNFIYELFMPTGRKIKNTIVVLIIMSLVLLLLLITGDDLGINVIKVNQSLTLVSLIKVICYIAISLLAVKLIFHIVFQVWQYKCISYRFYEDHLIYEDNFLNQHKKNIQYSDIKEVEIRRSIWDRILGYGIIVIYTNAENEYSNGLVIYSIRHPQEYYQQIDVLVHQTKKETITKKIEDKVEIEKDEKKFNESLKNINK